jgi:hypothetical protein
MILYASQWFSMLLYAFLCSLCFSMILYASLCFSMLLYTSQWFCMLLYAFLCFSMILYASLCFSLVLDGILSAYTWYQHNGIETENFNIKYIGCLVFGLHGGRRQRITVSAALRIALCNSPNNANLSVHFAPYELDHAAQEPACVAAASDCRKERLHYRLSLLFTVGKAAVLFTQNGFLR